MGLVAVCVCGDGDGGVVVERELDGRARSCLICDGGAYVGDLTIGRRGDLDAAVFDGEGHAVGDAGALDRCRDGVRAEREVVCGGVRPVAVVIDGNSDGHAIDIEREL